MKQSASCKTWRVTAVSADGMSGAVLTNERRHVVLCVLIYAGQPTVDLWLLDRHNASPPIHRRQIIGDVTIPYVILASHTLYRV